MASHGSAVAGSSETRISGRRGGSATTSWPSAPPTAATAWSCRAASATSAVTGSPACGSRQCARRGHGTAATPPSVTGSSSLTACAPTWWRRAPATARSARSWSRRTAALRATAASTASMATLVPSAPSHGSVTRETR
ncbi:hypothetical protein BS78_K173600 [Paspalum vaginatum]|uniref:Uncharacterized protein n=1 Tax=Paspalum vaginatum TaxID=158149 RepID=A0A9W7XBV1_9POAL|nr:hypothetical protein BS78_K173600 [Paspalum vaginatum]